MRKFQRVFFEMPYSKIEKKQNGGTFMSFILAPFSLLLGMLNGIFNSYGLAIIVFALFVKILLFPFSIKGKKGMIQMNMISGEMAKIKQQYGKDPQRYNEEVQALYVREQVNPLSGCLWSLLPLFVLLPLYAIIRQPLAYISGLSDDQILMLANQVNWDVVAVELGMVSQEVIDKALAKSVEAGGIISGFTSQAYDQLYLASLIPETGVTLSDGTKVAYMNFDFFGINLTHVPNWKLWQDFSYTNIMTLILVFVSAGTGFLFSKITQKTNKLNSNQPVNEQTERMNRTMLITMPITSIWIGFIMPSIMVVYWITNNLLSMVQEMVAGQVLKKDYEEARANAEKRALEEKEREKKEKQEKIKEIEKKRQEQQNNKGKSSKKKKKVPTEEEADKLDKEASREGMRTYARGRAYDPNRYPNPYQYDAPPSDGIPAPQYEEIDPEVLKKIGKTKKNSSGEKKNKGGSSTGFAPDTEGIESKESNLSKKDLSLEKRELSATEEQQLEWEKQKALLRSEIPVEEEESEEEEKSEEEEESEEA